MAALPAVLHSAGRRPAATCLPEEHTQQTGRGLAELHGLRVGETHRPRAARLITDSAIEGLKGTVRFEWAALDAWFEEDEQVFVHPRDPYSRVDALRSNRRVRVELDGVVLADSASPVMVFETGLPVRYYINRTDVRFEHLVPSDTVTSCPYKGMTSGYWSVLVSRHRTQGPWPGPTTSRPGSCCRSPAWSRSTTRWSTPTSTASAWIVRRHISPERAGMGAEPLLHAAVINNARWCDAVCRSHGYPGEFGGRLWISAGHALPFYPNAITLSPDVTAAEATASQDLSRPFAIKDSFARLDLAPHGLTPLFDATWMVVPAPVGGDEPSWDVVTKPGDLVRWEAAWAGGGEVSGLFQPALLADADCAVWPAPGRHPGRRGYRLYGGQGYRNFERVQIRNRLRGTVGGRDAGRGRALARPADRRLRTWRGPSHRAAGRVHDPGAAAGLGARISRSVAGPRRRRPAPG